MVGWLTKRRRRGRSYRSAGRSLERALVSQRSHSQMLVADVRSSSARRKSDSCAAAARRLPQVRLSSWPHTLAFTCAHGTRHPIHCTLLVGGEIMVRSYSAARDLWQLRVRRGHETSGVWGNLGATGHVDRASECGRSGAGRESEARGAPGPQQTRVRGSRWHARGHNVRRTHEVRACDRQLSVMRQRGCRRTSRL